MSETVTQKEVLVCGLGPAERIESILPELGGELKLKRVDTKDELLAALAAGLQPVCVIEHQVPLCDPVKSWNELAKAAGGDERLTSFLFKDFMAKRPVGNDSWVTAYQLLPELVSRSPGTQFVITSHLRGSGLKPEEREQYKGRQEVVKVMGFCNSTANYHYLMKLFSRVYFNRTWKPRPPAE
jgi:hypothetical protein